MLIELIKALLIGIIASSPIGPVSLIVMQKTLCHGRMAGFAAGVGSALVDTFYAVASLLAFMFVQDFFSRHEAWIMIGGGLLVATVGVIMLRRKSIDTVRTEDPSKTKAVQYALQAGGCALANPLALTYMFGLVALFRLDIAETVSPTWLIVLFVFAGALVWWFSFVFAADKLRNAISVKSLNLVNLIAGVAVIFFGVVLLVRGIVVL